MTLILGVRGTKSAAADMLIRTGRAVALIGVLAPLVLIGGMKFTAVEIAVIEAIVRSTLWLAWLLPLFGAAGTSYFLGMIELTTAALLLAGIMWPRAAIAGAALAALTFLVTCSLMIAQPIWDAAIGFPALGPAGQFLIKDIALLGIAIVIMGESWQRVAAAMYVRPDR